MDNDYPTTPYSSHEQMQLMRDVEKSKLTAFEENDEERLRQLRQIKYEC